jgi:uncharacterized repeat protein (TIGR03803 family)
MRISLSVFCLAAAFASPAAAKPGKLSPLLQFSGTDGWTVEGNIAAWGGGILAAAYGTSSANFLQPPAVSGGAWTSTILYRFTGQGGEGQFPATGLVVSAGKIYGTTSGGGSSACAGGCGTLFELNPPATSGGAWTETQLWLFAASDTGWNPQTPPLPIGKAIYGTTVHALNDTSRPGATSPTGGIVYQLSTVHGTQLVQVLHHFDASSLDGDTPSGPLTAAPGGTIYGTTFTGGACNQGTVYQLTPSGGTWTYTRVHDFGATATGCDYNDGEQPLAGVTLANGVLYGTTSSGTNPGCGTAFSIVPGATPVYTKLYDFGQTSTDACGPAAPVSVDAAGNIYGSTTRGGSGPVSTECGAGCGTLYELSPAAAGQPYTMKVLYSFTGGLDGSEPRTNLLGSPGKTRIGAASHGGFATDTTNPDYESYGTLFQYKP